MEFLLLVFFLYPWSVFTIMFTLAALIEDIPASVKCQVQRLNYFNQEIFPQLRKELEATRG